MNELLDMLNVSPPENTYLGDDGLMHCAICHAPTQYVLQMPNETRVVSIPCECRKAELEKEEKRKQMMARERIRRHCFTQPTMSGWTFGNDDRKNAELSDAMYNYATQFDDFSKDGTGLLLYGGVGTGKTYYAACIANHLIDRGYTVMLRKFSEITGQIEQNYGNKLEVINDLRRYKLLILDDLGAERKSDYMQEMVLDIVDARYRSGLPFIVTTNLAPDEIKKSQITAYQRIYDRIMERCYPKEVAGGSRRRAALKTKYGEISRKLGLS